MRLFTEARALEAPLHEALLVLAAPRLRICLPLREHRPLLGKSQAKRIEPKLSRV